MSGRYYATKYPDGAHVHVLRGETGAPPFASLCGATFDLDKVATTNDPTGFYGIPCDACKAKIAQIEAGTAVTAKDFGSDLARILMKRVNRGGGGKKRPKPRPGKR